MGSWILDKRSIRGKGWQDNSRNYTCSECGTSHLARYHDLAYGRAYCYFTMPKFCPECGDKKKYTEFIRWDD